MVPRGGEGEGEALPGLPTMWPSPLCPPASLGWCRVQMRCTRMLFQKLGEGVVGPASMPTAWRAKRSSLSLRVGELWHGWRATLYGPYGEGQHH